MIEARFDGTWEGWRDTARGLLANEIRPQEVLWTQETGQQALSGILATVDTGTSVPLRVPRGFLEDAAVVACHRSPEPWAVLYRLLYRLTHGERHLLEVTSDKDVLEFRRMEKAVRRDIHKMHAFVRFRKTGENRYVAWHRPDHRIARINAPFFVRRFGSMHWAILTPDESAYWDTQTLRFGPGVPRSEAPAQDDLEELWRTYYASVFNPARVKVNAMVKEMAVRHWPTLPEADIIPKLLAEAGTRVEVMGAARRESAAPFVPETVELPVLREAAAVCEGCDLHRHATRTVFGEGPLDGGVVFVGEQPGDLEDLAGRPFVGPAGQLLDEVLREAGIDRESLYITNAVKHFKFEERGKRRIHQTPRGVEIAACRPWLEAEMKILQPRLIVCLGATAAQSVFGRAVRVNAERGQFLPNHMAEAAFVTIHPSALLRMPDPAMAAAERSRFVEELRRVRAWLG